MDVLDKYSGFVFLEGGDEPFFFIETFGRTAEIDSMAADEDEMFWD